MHDSAQIANPQTMMVFRPKCLSRTNEKQINVNIMTLMSTGTSRTIYPLNYISAIYPPYRVIAKAPENCCIMVKSAVTIKAR